MSHIKSRKAFADGADLIPQVTEAGYRKIEAFLIEKHRLGSGHEWSNAELRIHAWQAEYRIAQSEGGHYAVTGVVIALDEWETMSGEIETLTLSEADGDYGYIRRQPWHTRENT
ncbi:MAG: hypothetical protein FWC38_00650 [Proteobacteria bacterium]|nr:hypothetical protein [Pseudomonadota bacterium]MCL2306751.1 hypothetical protein [Pseudomonadota bacterium]